jgi:hypothetical protein
MSFPQQSRSDMAAAVADERRKQLQESASTVRPGASASEHNSGVIARMRSWLRRRFVR